ncbi:hypothetical protein TNCV_1993021 [Trichonephila clavipes]|nr:hypothetical protein TNCV_1993021 [Trichonephila clavipes]
MDTQRSPSETGSPLEDLCRALTERRSEVPQREGCSLPSAHRGVQCDGTEDDTGGKSFQGTVPQWDSDNTSGGLFLLFSLNVALILSLSD